MITTCIIFHGNNKKQLIETFFFLTLILRYRVITKQTIKKVSKKQTEAWKQTHELRADLSFSSCVLCPCRLMLLVGK